MEVWKDIEGYEGLYQISNLGNVVSLNYALRGYSSLLKPKINPHGYAWVDLRKNNTSKPMLIHRLVALAFLDNPNNYPFINHKDENPLNNNLENLEWCTHEYNVHYSLSLHPTRISDKAKERRKKGIVLKRKYTPYKKSKRVRQIDISSGEVIKEYCYISEAARALKKKDANIRECCKGNRKTAYGYKWEFCE